MEGQAEFPRRIVIIDEEHSEEFIRKVDNPEYNPKMARLMKEALETFPDES